MAIGSQPQLQGPLRSFQKYLVVLIITALVRWWLILPLLRVPGQAGLPEAQLVW